MKIGFIINSLLADLENLREQFTKANLFGFDLFFYPTQKPRHATELTIEATTQRCDWIVSVGGDGTLNEIVNALIDAGKNKEVKLAILPYGTGNDYSVSMRTLHEPRSLLHSISKGKTCSVDVGKVEYHNGGYRYFINVADAGMGGEVTRIIKTSGNPFGRWVYYKTILRTFFSYKRPVVSIVSKEKTMEKKIITVVIGKGRSFAGGYKIPYKARLDDGRFFVVVIGNLSFLTYTLKLPYILSGKHIKHPDVYYFYADKITIENISGDPCFFEMDGEPGESIPATAKCLPSMVEFLDVTSG